MIREALSPLDVAAFIIIPLGLALAFVAAVWFAWNRSAPAKAGRATTLAGVGTAGWLAVSWELATSGVLQRWNATPPPFGFLVVTVVLLAMRLAFGPVGRRFAQTIPLWLLVGVQGFRLPLEMAMHSLYERGLMPGQMSYGGRNYDVLTGVTALILAILIGAGKAGPRIVRLWNIVGLLLLVNVVVVAVLATPRIAYFGNANVNTIVTYAPFVWLPAVMVLAALAGHLVIFRALRQPR